MKEEKQTPPTNPTPQKQNKNNKKRKTFHSHLPKKSTQRTKSFTKLEETEDYFYDSINQP